MIIAVSGSSGTGKTIIAKALARKLRYNYIDVNKLIKDNGLRGKYLKKFDSYEVDVKKLNKILISLIKKNNNLIIDSHLSHYLPNKYVDYCFVCKCDLKVLKNRLKLRGYSDIKVKENLDSEIFDVCLVEATENKHSVIVVDTTRNSAGNCVKEILKKLSSKSSIPI